MIVQTTSPLSLCYDVNYRHLVISKRDKEKTGFDLFVPALRKQAHKVFDEELFNCA